MKVLCGTHQGLSAPLTNIFFKYFYFELTSMNFKVHHVVRKPNTVFMFYMNSVLQTYNSIKEKLQKCLYAVNYNS